MRRIIQDLSDSYRELPTAIVGAMFLALLTLAIMLALGLFTGCAHSRAGLAREQAAFQVSTNVVTQVHALVPFTPAPTNYLAESVLAAISAGLTAWNVSQHRRLKLLENGKTTPKAPTP